MSRGAAARRGGRAGHRIVMASSRGLHSPSVACCLVPTAPRDQRPFGGREVRPACWACSAPFLARGHALRDLRRRGGRMRR